MFTFPAMNRSLCLLLLLTYITLPHHVICEQPRIRFTVTPALFLFNTPFTARCTVSTFNPTGQNFEITFYMLENSSSQSFPHGRKVPIGTYLITNQRTPVWRYRIRNETLMTVTEGFQTDFPNFEVMILPRAAEARTTYGCYMKNGISLGTEEIHSNTWNANGSLSPSASMSLVSFIIMNSAIRFLFN